MTTRGHHGLMFDDSAPAPSTLYSSDGSTMSGWAASGMIGVDSGSGNPPPCIRSSAYAYAYRPVSGARRWVLEMATGSNSICHLQFGCDASGAGPSFRIETRPGQPSGLNTHTAWNNSPTGPSGAGALPTFAANTIYQIDVRLNPAGTAVDVYVDGVLTLSNVAVSILGDYIALAGSVLSTSIFDNIDIYP